MELVEFLDDNGRSPFEVWFNRINAQVAAKMTTALVRLESGHTSNIKSAGGGVYELKIDFGPGYRIYLDMTIPKQSYFWPVGQRSDSISILAQQKRDG